MSVNFCFAGDVIGITDTVRQFVGNQGNYGVTERLRGVGLAVSRVKRAGANNSVTTGREKSETKSKKKA